MTLKSGYFRFRLLFALAFFLAAQAPHAVAEVWDQLFAEQLESAEGGDPDAQYEVAIMYLSGRGVAQDFDAALHWLELAAGNGSDSAAAKLKRIQSQKKKFTATLAKAEAGQAASQYNLGMMYLKGRGVKQDAASGRQWLEKAAAQSHEKAVTRLAILFLKGEGGAPDYDRARQLLSSVSERSALAQYYLGELYAAGKGVPRDYETAMSWYRKAAENGFSMAGGKIINVEEEIRMQARRKANAEKAAAERQRKRAAAKQNDQRVAAAKAARAEVARKASAAKDREVQKKKVAVVRPAPAAKPAVVLSGLEKLGNARWTAHDKPMEYLPSAVTQCELDNGVLVCFSEELKRESGNQTVLYKVKSEVRQDKGGFAIAYRNLVLGVEDMDIADGDEDASGYDDEVDQGFSIQTGWTRAHQVICQPEGDGAMNCIKDKTHRVRVVEDVQVASTPASSAKPGQQNNAGAKQP